MENQKWKPLEKTGVPFLDPLSKNPGCGGGRLVQLFRWKLLVLPVHSVNLMSGNLMFAMRMPMYIRLNEARVYVYSIY